jgi:hypothetical protein
MRFLALALTLTLTFAGAGAATLALALFHAVIALLMTMSAVMNTRLLLMRCLMMRSGARF